jgi:chromosome segregation ATPase
MTRYAAPRLAAAVLMFSGLALAHAQTNPPAKPAKPAAAPAAAATPSKAAEPKTLSLGGGTGGASGPLLTREELRACMNRQQALNTQRGEIEAARAPLDADRESLLKAQDALKAERARMEGARQSAIDELNARNKAYGERVTAFNERAKAAAELAPSGREREAKALERERPEIDKQKQALEAERVKLVESTQREVEAYNARAIALDQQVAEWTQRENALGERAKAVNAERDRWAGECADRRYREDDEIAIKRGQ